jgi:hypothetical protein
MRGTFFLPSFRRPVTANPNFGKSVPATDQVADGDQRQTEESADGSEDSGRPRLAAIRSWPLRAGEEHQKHPARAPH